MMFSYLWRLPIAALRLAAGVVSGPDVVAGRDEPRAARLQRVVYYVGRVESDGGVVYAFDHEVRRLAPAPGLPSPALWWGSPGDGALALSYRILTDFIGRTPAAERARAFSEAVVEQLDADGFVLSGERVGDWLRSRPRKQPR